MNRLGAEPCSIVALRGRSLGSRKSGVRVPRHDRCFGVRRVGGKARLLSIKPERKEPGAELPPPRLRNESSAATHPSVETPRSGTSPRTATRSQVCADQHVVELSFRPAGLSDDALPRIVGNAPAKVYFRK